MGVKESIYVDKGYLGRWDYLEQMSEQYGVDLEVVYLMADIQGESEMFDGLISELKEMGEYA